MSCSASVTHGAGRGVLKQPIAIGIQPSMIAARAHSPIVFGIVFEPVLEAAGGRVEALDGLEHVGVGRRRCCGRRVPSVVWQGAHLAMKIGLTSFV